MHLPQGLPLFLILFLFLSFLDGLLLHPLELGFSHDLFDLIRGQLRLELVIGQLIALLLASIERNVETLDLLPVLRLVVALHHLEEVFSALFFSLIL